MRILLKKFAPYGTIFFILVVLFGNILFPPKDTIIYGGDLNDQFYYWKSFLVESIKRGEIPFWNPYNFAGAPFLSHPSVAPFYPFTIIFFLLPYNVSFSWYIIIHLFLAGSFLYWFMRKKFDPLAALSSALVFSLSGFFAARIYSGHIDIISTAAWMPLTFGAIVLFLESSRKRFFILSIISLTLQILAGYQFLGMVTFELLVLFAIFYLVYGLYRKRPFRSLLKKILLLGCAVFIAIGLSAVQTLPTFELVKHSIRANGLPYSLVSWGSYTVEMFRLFLWPFSFGNPFPENYTYLGPGPNYFELAYYVGVFPVLLFAFYALLQIFNLLKQTKIDRLFAFFAVGIGFFSLLALGSNFPFHKVLYTLLPPYTIFRFPAQHLTVVVLLLSCTTGLVLHQIKNRQLKLLIIFLLTIDLITFDKSFIRLADIPIKQFDQGLVETLKTNDSRFLPDYPVTSKLRNAIDFEAATAFRLQTTSGYNPIVLDNYYRFIDALNKAPVSSVPYFNVEIPPPDPTSPLVNFLNIRFLLAERALPAITSLSNPTYKAVAEKPNYILYENQTPASRFQLTGKVVGYDTSDDVARFFRNANTDLSDITVMTNDQLQNLVGKDFTCEEKPRGTIDIESYALNTIKLRVEAYCNSLLASSEVYYPGWQAKVDGKSQNILLSNLAFRTLYIPKGVHMVEYYYSPVIYISGAVVSIISLVFFLFFLRVTKWEKR